MDDRTVLSEVEILLRQYVPGPFRWSAKQSSGPDDWCIAIGQGAACFTLDERTRALDDAFIRELATQILGYPPGSIPDLERQLEEAKKQSARARNLANQYQNEAVYWEGIESELMGKLLAAMPTTPGNTNGD